MREYSGALCACGRRTEGDVVRGMQRVVCVSSGESLQHDEGVRLAAQVLTSGGLALIPTETVYGLGVSVNPLIASYAGARALDDGSAPIAGQPLVNGAAVPPPESGYRRIFSVKRRELAQTVPWLVSGVEALDEYGCDVDSATRALARAFWPGGLTLIVRARDNVPAYMQAADGTVALRCSASPVVAALIEACGGPLATTSANTHGAPAPTAFCDVEQAVLDGVDIAIDAGETTCRDASTIVSCLGGDLTIIRRGALSVKAIERVAAAAGVRVAASREE